MQKEDWLKDSDSDLETLLKKAAKVDNHETDLESVMRFKVMMEENDKYWRDKDISPKYIMDYKHIYHWASEPEHWEEYLKRLSNIKIREEMEEHREAIFKIITEISNQELEEIKDEEAHRLYKIITEKALFDEESKKQDILKRNSKQQRRNKVMEKFSLKRPIYENCKILAPDGEILCKWDKKKVQWYLERDLAELIKEEPLTVKLKFEPSGRGITNFSDEKDDDEFYVEERSNICVAWGNGKNYLRHQIIPGKFRIFFPEKYKSHRSHDVLLLCFDCNEISIKKQAELEAKLSKQYNVPMKVLDADAQMRETVTLFQRKPRGIIRGRKKIPEDRLLLMYKDFLEASEELIEKRVLKGEDQNNLGEFINKNKGEDLEIDYEFLEKAIKFKPKKTTTIANKRQNIFGKLIIEKYGGTEKIPDFIKMWRQYFLDNLNPKFLPKNWSVDHSIARVFGNKSAFKNDD